MSIVAETGQRENQFDTAGEQWRPVPGWPYEASNLGRLRVVDVHSTHEFGTIINPWTKGQKYPMVRLVRGNSVPRDHWQVALHRVVAEAWIGPMPAPGWELDHKDGNRHNNCLDNLEWVPAEKNIQRLVRRLGFHGEKRWNATLTEELVREMRRLRAAGLSVPAIADRLGASESAVAHVVAGRSWKHVTVEMQVHGLEEQNS